MSHLTTNIDTLLAEKMLQFKLTAAHFVRVPAGQAPGFTPYVLLGRAAICDHEENNGLQDSPWAGCPYREVGGGREAPTALFHTCLGGEVIE
jgi:hypothetical protein